MKRITILTVLLFLLSPVVAPGQTYSGERNFNGVHYLTLDAICENNNPDPGDYLIRVQVDDDGGLSYKKVHMDYAKKK